MDTPTRYKILNLLEKDPTLSQRALADRLGLSLGKTNYCLKALIEKGWVKVGNFRRSNRKIGYLYNLTPRGLAAKTRITRRFLKRKMDEHERIKREIDELQKEVKGN